MTKPAATGARTLWLIALADVIFLPVILYSFVGGREQTSIVDRLLSITGVQSAGLLLYTVALATKLKSPDSPFGVPLHRWVGFSLVGFVCAHVVLALMSNPQNYLLLTFVDAPARGAAATAALLCWLAALLLGEFRRQSGLNAKRWRPFHVGLAWLGAIFALAHILWIDQLVNEGVWLLLFAGIVVTTIYLWVTRAKGVSKSTEGAVPKIVRWALVIGAVLAVVVTVLAWRVPDALTIGYTQTETGPIGPADRDMLYKVKQAGLWEMQVGAEASERATNPKLREVAPKINAEHHELDHIVTDAANQLGVILPTEPTPDQQSWIATISASANGEEYDRNAVFLLRQAHGKVLPLLAQVKVGTRNQIVRDVATAGMDFVSRHISYLESTGLVDFSQLPEPPAPSPYQQPVEASFFDYNDTRTVIISSVVVAVLGSLLAFVLVAMLKSRSNGRPKKPPHVPRHRKVGE